MAFESWQAFWHMGGHGPFVWSSYAVTLVVMAGLVLQPLLRRRRLLREIHARDAREKNRAAAAR